MPTDVVVVGAGLTGLQAARELEQRGLSVQVVEAADAVGGRIRTDVVDGFRCDRGFQVLNPGYPRVRQDVNVKALRLQRFGRGVGVLHDRGRTVLADPSKRPGRLPRMLRSSYASPEEITGLLRWMVPAFAPGRAAGRHGGDDGWGASLDRAGVTGRLRSEVVDRFLEGTILEAEGVSSTEYVRELLRAFVRATPGLPEAGMQAFPEQLAGRLRTPVRLHTRVTALDEGDDGVAVRLHGETLEAHAVLVAVAPQELPQLTRMPVPETKGLWTWWFATDERPTELDMLLLDSRSNPGPCVNTCVVSNAAPSYAPAGQHLVQATAVGRGAAPDEGAVRRQLGEVYGCDSSGWRLLVRHDLPHALPVQPAPLEPSGAVVQHRIVVAGDHTETASIQGALTAGSHAAQAVASLL